ncbi:hypothetical protein AB0J89_19730 [Micromonospora chokoriensis]
MRTAQACDGGGDSPAEDATESGAEGLMPGQQGGHDQPVVGMFQLDVVDLADGDAVAVDDLPLKQVESDEDDAAAVWRAWAPDLEHRTVTCGHFMAEEAPAEVVPALRALLAR